MWVSNHSIYPTPTKSRDARKQKEESCKNLNSLFKLTIYRYILNECKKLKVKIQKPKSIKSFLEALSAVKNAKNKASNLLFEEIEHDVRDKEKFVIE